ncbi:MAG TPA: peptidoglycan editing factor PgeF [Rhodanobacteraceae bacterium]
MDTFPKPEACCGGALLHAALRHEFEAAVIRPEWPVPANVRAAVTTREGPSPVRDSAYGFNVGTRCGDAPELVARNRAFLREALQLPAEPHWLRQVHRTRVVVLDCPHPNPLPQAGEGNARSDSLVPSLPPRVGEGARRTDGAGDALEPEADAAATRAHGVVLAIQTADCLPVLFAAGDGSAIAAAHAGWRGLCAGVLENTLAALDAPLDGVVAWLGPAIAARSYEVGSEVRDAFVAHDPLAMSAFKPSRAQHWYCDLYQLARLRLRHAGVTRIFGGGFDTFTDLRLHSYRRDGAQSGRMVSLLWMVPAGAVAVGNLPR